MTAKESGLAEISTSNKIENEFSFDNNRENCKGRIKFSMKGDATLTYSNSGELGVSFEKNERSNSPDDFNTSN